MLNRNRIVTGALALALLAFPLALTACGGSDKGPDGHRKDTMPIVNAIKEQGWDAEVIYFHPDKAEEIYAQVSENFDAYISRVNPGNIPGGEKGYFQMPTRPASASLVSNSK